MILGVHLAFSVLPAAHVTPSIPLVLRCPLPGKTLAQTSGR